MGERKCNRLRRGARTPVRAPRRLVPFPILPMMTPMTAFIYLTDSHLGAANDHGYRQQPRYADRLPELCERLDAWIRRRPTPIDFILHGGDMVDTVSAAAVRAAVETFRFSVPVYLSLGNHDLTAPDALAIWRSRGAAFFPEGDPAYTLAGEGWRLHVVPTQWCDVPYYWKEAQRPHLLPEHLAQVEAALARDPEAAHLLCTHAEVLPVPPEQTGFEAPYHAPAAEIVATVQDLVARYPQLRGVLGGHNHINTHGRIGHAHAVTASAFAETPFEFKLIEVTAATFAMQTVALLPEVGFRADYRWDKTFVQGRLRDRVVGG